MNAAASGRHRRGVFRLSARRQFITFFAGKSLTSPTLATAAGFVAAAAPPAAVEGVLRHSMRLGVDIVDNARVHS
jgi:hypothetical protein